MAGEGRIRRGRGGADRVGQRAEWPAL